ncbi:MAG: CPBP family intramembrane metalloprotease, partial [Prevotella sp.]|nr:CPBP family intramembrane metalloprotease [Prevotella sp.]
MKKAIIYLIEFLAIQFILGSVIQGIYVLAKGSITPDASAPLMIASTVVSNLVIIILFLWTRWTPVSMNYVKSRPWGVAFWTILAALGTLLPSMWLQEVLPELPNLIADDLTNIINTPGGYLAIAVAAPVAEEVVFRGAILRALLQGGRRPWVAIAISAILFAIGHLNPA